MYDWIKRILFCSIVLCIMLSFIGLVYKENKRYLSEGFYLLGEDKIVLEYGNQYKDDGFIASINKKDYKNKVKINSDLNPNKIGKYAITYNLNYNNIIKELHRDVEVKDTIKPVITINDDKEIYVTVNEKLENIKYQAIDNYDGDITDNVVIDSNVNINKKGDYKIIYSVKDSSGNEGTEEVIVHVQNKFDHTYIKVSISKQKLRYYEYNKLVLETDVTTGMNNATKLGKFKINNKVRNTVLSTKKYKSYVSYWMAYSGSNFGIHDAQWRSKFGGNIYKTNGSHGCVNVPLKAMKKLYNMVEVGTPVYIELK